MKMERLNFKTICIILICMAILLIPNIIKERSGNIDRTLLSLYATSMYSAIKAK